MKRPKANRQLPKRQPREPNSVYIRASGADRYGARFTKTNFRNMIRTAREHARLVDMREPSQAEVMRSKGYYC